MEALSLIFSELGAVLKLPQRKWHLGLHIAVVIIRDSDILAFNLKCAGCLINLIVIAVFPAILSPYILKVIICLITGNWCLFGFLLEILAKNTFLIRWCLPCFLLEQSMNHFWALDYSLSEELLFLFNKNTDSCWGLVNRNIGRRFNSFFHSR